MKRSATMFILLLAINISCALKHNVSEEDAIALLYDYFNAIDIENIDSDMIDNIVTDDYFIYEAEKKYPKKEFIAFIKEQYNIHNTRSSEWIFSDFRVSTDLNSAHMSYVNKGEFISQDGVATRMEWLETGYLVRTDAGLKMKFLFSDNINMETVQL